MANITRIDPFDDLFRGFFVRPVDFKGAPAQTPSIKMDVQEQGDSYLVHAELPGVKKEDIDIQVEGNVVRISAESRQEREEKQGKRVIRSERYVGRVMRSFTLGMNVDDSAASAKFENGVLELTLPKKSLAESRCKITVE